MKEGNSFSNLLLLMKQQGFNKENDITVGLVKSISPLSINLGNYILVEEDMFIAEQLRDHERLVDMVVPPATTGTKYTMKIKSPLAVGDSVLVLIQNSDFYLVDKVVEG